MKYVPPAPLSSLNRAKTFAGERVDTDRSSHSRHAITSIAPSDDAAASSGAAFARSGDARTTAFIPPEPSASTAPLSSPISWDVPSLV